MSAAAVEVSLVLFPTTFSRKKWGCWQPQNDKQFHFTPTAPGRGAFDKCLNFLQFMLRQFFPTQASSSSSRRMSA
jgi:hypothetical protein